MRPMEINVAVNSQLAPNHAQQPIHAIQTAGMPLLLPLCVGMLVARDVVETTGVQPHNPLTLKKQQTRTPPPFPDHYTP